MYNMRKLEFLQLPTELLQLILLECTTLTFLQLSLTCTTMHEIASTCREVILRHLYLTPGLNGLEDLATPQLWQILKRRTAEELLGARFHSDVTNYIFSEGIIDNPASTLRVCDPSLSNVVLVPKNGDCAYSYRVNSGEVTLDYIFEAPYYFPGRLDVIKTAFARDGAITMLRKYEPAEDLDQSAPVNSFLNSMQKRFQTAGYHLATQHPSSQKEPVIGLLDEVDGFIPTAIAVSQPNKVIIAWANEKHLNHKMVVLHTCSHDEAASSRFVYTSTILSDNVPHMKRPIVPPVVRIDLNDNDTQALIYMKSSPLYNSYIPLPNPDVADGEPRNRWKGNWCFVPFNGEDISFTIGIPFFCTHLTYQRPPRPYHMCQWRYLSIGIATHPVQGWTIACLLRSEARCRARHCGHVPNLDRGRRFDEWTVMARLWGYEKSEDSLAGLVATSKRGKRIAIAKWNKIYLWVLNPEVIIEGEEGGEWEYYPEYMKNDDMIQLKPIVLELDAVCLNLKFTSCEDELIALTDKGLMKWDLGPKGKGFRVKKFLDMKLKNGGESSRTLPPDAEMEDTQMSGV